MATYWTLSQAIAWIATQSEDAVAEAPLTVIRLALAESSTPDATRYFEAKAKLWRALQGGELIATGIHEYGKRQRIPAELWADLQAYLDGSIERLSSNPTHTGDSFAKVRVSAAEVAQWLDRGGQSVPKSTLSHKQTRRNQAVGVADIIVKHWPNGQPVGMKVGDWDRLIRDKLKADGIPVVSNRTLQRARQHAKSRPEANRRE